MSRVGVKLGERAAATARVGGTPLVRVESLDTGACELFLKLESHNPGGSIKDRIGEAMVEQALERGLLGPGRTKLVEATAGNTGLGLALACARRGLELTLVIPDKMSTEKVLHAKALGAGVVITRSDVSKGHPAYYVDLARSLAEKQGAFHVNQFENPANPLAHEQSTGPELWRQLDGRLDAIVCGVGSGGTLTGLSRFFSRAAPEVEIVLADPIGSVLADVVRTGKPGASGSFLVEGIGQDAVPPICDLSRVRRAYSIGDREAFTTLHQLLQREGILAGSSSGTLLAAALRYCREQTQPRRVVTFVCDTGNKYLSKAFNQHWLRDVGVLDEPACGDLRDVIGRKSSAGEVIAVTPDDSLAFAYARMRLTDVSQLPVLDRGKLVGIVDESDLLVRVWDDPEAYSSRVRECMSTRLETVDVRTPVRELAPLFARGLVAIVMDGDDFLGLITRSDLLAALRRRHPR